MKTVGVFEAKARLSEVLADVSAGKQAYLVTRKGTPVAEIRPVSSGRAEMQAAAEGLRRLAREVAEQHGAVSATKVRAMRDRDRR